MKKLKWPPLDIMKTQRYQTFISGMLAVMGDQHDAHVIKYHQNNNLDNIVGGFDTQLSLPLVGGKNPTNHDVDFDL